MLRIDPLTEQKTVDMEFFSNKEEYEKHKRIVEKYIKDEGFDLVQDEGEMVIQIQTRWWSIRNLKD